MFEYVSEVVHFCFLIGWLLQRLEGPSGDRFNTICCVFFKVRNRRTSRKDRVSAKNWLCYLWDFLQSNIKMAKVTSSEITSFVNSVPQLGPPHVARLNGLKMILTVSVYSWELNKSTEMKISSCNKKLQMQREWRMRKNVLNKKGKKWTFDASEFSAILAEKSLRW